MIDSRKPRMPERPHVAGPIRDPEPNPVDFKALPYLEEVNKGCWLKKNAHDGDFARWNSFSNACGAGREAQGFFKGVPRGFKGAIQENIRFQNVLLRGAGRLHRKVKMNLVNKEY